jgi:hypothetical protein
VTTMRSRGSLERPALLEVDGMGRMCLASKVCVREPGGMSKVAGDSK